MKRGRLLKTTFVTLMVCATAGTLFACGEDKEYKVVYLGGEGATGEAPAEATYKEGDTFIVANNPFTKEDHTFKGWSDGTSTYLEGVKYTMGTADVTFTALWEKNTTAETYTVTYALGENAATDATAPAGVSEKHYGDRITLPAAPAAATGYEFAGWKVGSAAPLKTAGSEIEITGSVTITAIYQAKEQYTATFHVGDHAEEGATVDPIPVYYDNAEITLPAAPAPATGYEFAGWKVGSDTKAAGEKITLTANAEITAQWNAIEYTVTYALGENAATGATAPAGLSEKHYGDKINLPAAPAAATGYEFAGWKVGSDATLKAAEAEIEITGTVTITAIYQAKAQYTATLNVGDHALAGATVDPITVYYDDAEITLPAAPAAAAGYEFAGWKVGNDATLKAVGEKVTLSASVEITAQWNALEYTVTYALGENAAAGATAPTAVPQKHYGDTINLPAAPAAATGYEFAGWKVGSDATLKAAQAEIEITGSVTVTAIYQAKAQYTATFNVGDHALAGATAADSITVYYDDAEITLPAAPSAATGYTFAGWQVGSDTTLKAAEAKINLTATVTITAQWKQEEYTVTYALGENAATGVTAPAAVSEKHYGDKINLPAAPAAATGYEFAGWKVGSDATLKAAQAEIEITCSVTVTAIYQAKAQYTATFNMGDYAAAGAKVDSITVYYDDAEITLPAAPSAATGYRFAGWKVGTTDTILQAGAKRTLTADTVLTAQWVSTENSWTVTFLADEGDEEALSTQAVAKDAQGAAKKLALPATNPTKDGYRLLGWYLSTDAEKTLLDAEDLPDVEANMTVIAKWQAVFTVTVLDDLNGDEVDGAKTVYDNNGAGTPEKFVAPTGVEKGGYTLVGWFLVVDNEGTPAYGTQVTADTGITGNVTIAAKWEEIKYTVTYALGENAATTATAPEAVEVTHNTGRTTLPAAPAAATGYEFAGWQVGTDTDLKAAEAEIEVTGNVTVTAIYQAKEQYTATFSVGGHAAAGATVAPITVYYDDAKINLPAAPAAATGYGFAGWKVGTETDLKAAGAEITLTANVTITAQWYIAENEIKDSILNWYTDGSKSYYVANGEELTVQATITKDNPDAWTGIMVDIALNGDFYRFRPDHWIWTENLVHGAVGNPDAGIVREEPIWNDDTVDAYKALFANGASVIQVINIRLKDNVLTYTVTSYAGTDTELLNPVVSATSKVTSKTDISEIHPYFYADAGAVISTASAKVPKASNTYVNLTFDFDTEDVEDAVVSMRAGKGDYIFGANPVKAGYTFLGWKSSDETDTKLYKRNDKVAVTEAVTYTAQWEQEEYTVTYALGENAATGATAPTAVSEKHYGDTINLPAAPAAATGYEFAGWKVGSDANLKAAEAELEITGSVTITAIYQAKAQYTATFNVGDHALAGATAHDPVTVYYDDAEITLPAAPAAATGYTFAGWQVGSDTTLKAAEAKITLAATVTITAQWNAIEYTVSFNVGDHAAEGASVAEKKADYNTEIDVPAGPAAATGYTFAGWQVGTSDTVLQAGDKLLVTADTELTATWVATENSWTVTFLKNEGDQEAHSTQTVAKDATGTAKKLVLPATNPTKEGYRLLGWYLSTDTEKTLLTTETLPDVESHMTVIAKWQAVFTVTVLDDLNGDDVDGAKTVYDNNGDEGTPEKFVAPTGVEKGGFTFIGWFLVVDNEGVKAYGDEVTAQTDITANVTIAAKWEEIKYTVTYALGNHAATNVTAPEAVEVTHNTGKTTLPAALAAATNYAFSGWKVGTDTDLKAAGTEIEVTGNVTVTAIWVQVAETHEYALGAWADDLRYCFALGSGYFIEAEVNGYLTWENDAIWCGLVVKIEQPSHPDWFFFQNNVGTAMWDTAAEEFVWVNEKTGFDIKIKDGAGNDAAFDEDVYKNVRADGKTTVRISLAPAAEAGKYTLTAVTTLTAKDATTPTYVITRTRTVDDANLSVYFALDGKTANPAKITTSLPSAEKPIVITNTNYKPVNHTTVINKGEKIEFTGKSTSTENVNWFSPMVTLFRGARETLPFRSDNYIVGSGANDPYADNLAAEGWASVVNSNACSGDDLWATMCALKNNGDITITVDWTGEKIVVTIAYTGMVNGVASTYTQTYTVTLAEGNTDTNYYLALGGEKCTLAINSIVRTLASD